MLQYDVFSLTMIGLIKGTEGPKSIETKKGRKKEERREEGGGEGGEHAFILHHPHGDIDYSSLSVVVVVVGRRSHRLCVPVQDRR